MSVASRSSTIWSGGFGVRLDEQIASSASIFSGA
jgi:hypothetical protein